MVISEPLRSHCFFLMACQGNPLQASIHILRAKSTDRDKLTANKLTANQRFCYSDFVTDFAAVISSQSEGLGKMALGIVQMYLGSPFSPIGVVCGQFVRGQLVHGQLSWTTYFVVLEQLVSLSDKWSTLNISASFLF